MMRLPVRELSKKAISKYKYLLLIVLLLYISLSFQNIFAEDYLQWDRFHLNAKISTAELYSDNIYLAHSDTQDEFITRISPGLELESAISNSSRILVSYTGIFEHYDHMKNFRKDQHFGNINFKITSNKNSLFILGAKIEDNAQQPFYESDRSKDFWLTTGYSELEWNFNAISSIGTKYEHIIRKFDKEIDRESDYKRDIFNIHTLYTRNEDIPLLLEYRFEKHENDQMEPEPSELITHTVLTGLRFRPEKALSGMIAAGYAWSQFNNQAATEGWMTDIDLLYRIGAFTDLRLSGRIGITVSDRTVRDTLDYYDYKGFGATFTYHRFDPLHLSVEAAYMNRNYESTVAETDEREDDLYRLRIRTDYELKKWLALVLEYSYRDNHSNISELEYEENLFRIEAVFSI